MEKAEAVKITRNEIQPDIKWTLLEALSKCYFSEPLYRDDIKINII